VTFILRLLSFHILSLAIAMDLKGEKSDLAGTNASGSPVYETSQPGYTADPEHGVVQANKLHKSLKGRHMQMIAM
jgi:amino acid permease